MILFGVLFALLYYKCDATPKKIFAWPTIVFILFYSISFDYIKEVEVKENIFQYFTLRLTLRSYFLFFITCLSFLIGIFLTKYGSSVKDSAERRMYNYKRLEKLYYCFALCALIGFTINLSRVIGNMALLFISPRVYEELFGASSLINYLYFLNIPALLIWVYLHHHNIKIRFSPVINFLLVAISFFHGIKFTIFDTIGYPCIFYFLLEKRVSLRKIIFIGFFLLSVFLLFATLVRGAEDKSPFVTLLCYIIPNFYNLDYFVEIYPNTWGDFLALITPELFTSPTIAIGEREPIDSYFVFNPAYNMTTSLLPLYMTLNFVGPLVYILIFIFQNQIYRHRKQSLSLLFLATYLEYSLCFAFYFYAYTKFKNVFYVILFICIDFYCRKGKISPQRAKTKSINEST